MSAHLHSNRRAGAQAGQSDGSGKNRVIGAEDVQQAYRSGRDKLEVLPGDIVTDLAKETASSLSIDLHDGPIPVPAVPRTNSATRTQRQLYRRSARWSAPPKSTSANARTISRLVLIGAGGVGTNIAHLAANTGIAEHICLIDVAPGVAAATALDLEHATGISGSRTKMTGGESLDLVAGAEVVVVTAGRPRTTGMTRADLINVNQRVIESCAEAIRNLAPQSIVIVVTNPLDEMTLAMLNATQFPRQRVIGMAGTLDSSRFRVALAEAANCDARDVSAVTLGSHGDEMVPLTSLARIKGRAVTEILKPETIQQCVRRAVGGGGEVVALRKSGSATIAPAHSVIEVLEHMRGAREGAIPVSVQLDGEYGYSDVVMGVPAYLGTAGVVGIEELRLSTPERELLQAAYEASVQHQSG